MIGMILCLTILSLGMAFMFAVVGYAIGSGGDNDEVIPMFVIGGIVFYCFVILMSFSIGEEEGKRTALETFAEQPLEKEVAP